MTDAQTVGCEVGRCEEWPSFPMPLDDDTNVYMCWPHSREYCEHAGIEWAPTSEQISALTMPQFERWLEQTDMGARIRATLTSKDRATR